MCLSNGKAVIVDFYDYPSISVDDRQVATDSDDQMRNDSTLGSDVGTRRQAKSSTGLSRDMVISESRVGNS